MIFSSRSLSTFQTFIFASTLLGTSISSHASDTDRSFMERKSLSSRIRDVFTRITITGKINLDVDMIDGIRGLIGYTYEVEPAYLGKKFYTRVDNYRAGLQFRAGEMIDNLSPVFLNIDRNSEITFARLFESHREALTAAPLIPSQIPFNAERFSKLPVGTIASLPTKLNVMFGVQGTSLIGGDIGVGASAYYILSGDFNIQVLKLPHNKARFRVFSKRGAGLGSGAHVKGHLEFFEVRLIDKVVEKVINRDIASLYSQKFKGNLVIFDYLLDMNSANTRAAYDHVMASRFGFKEGQALDPFLRGKNVHETLLSDFREIEALAQSDLGKTNPRIRRIIRGIDQFDSYSLGYNLRLSVYNWSNTRQISKHHFQYVTEDATKEQSLLMLNRTDYNKQSWAFGFGRESLGRSHFAMAPATKDGKPLRSGISDIGFNFESKDLAMRSLEQQMASAAIIKQLPESISSKIEWNKILSEQSQSSVRVYFNVIFNLKAKQSFKRLTPEFIEREIRSFRDYLWKEKNYVIPGSDRDLEDFQQKLTHIIYNAMGGELKEDIMDQFNELAKDKTFAHFGIGAMLHVLEAAGARLKEVARVDMIWSAKGREPYYFKFGYSDQPDEYTTLEFIRAVILGSSTIDYRLVGYKP